MSPDPVEFFNILNRDFGHIFAKSCVDICGCPVYPDVRDAAVFNYSLAYFRNRSVTGYYQTGYFFEIFVLNFDYFLLELFFLCFES